MDKESRLTHLRSSLSKLSDMLSQHLDLIDVCTVDFITKDVFDNHLPKEIREELMIMSDEQLVQLPHRVLLRDGNGEHGGQGEGGGALGELICRISSHSLESLGVTIDGEDFDAVAWSSNAVAVNEEEDDDEIQLRHFDRIMGEKKTHEVQVLTNVIFRLCKDSQGGAPVIVDLGSGKGYLSQALRKVHNCNVLAIDASDGNTMGAKKRNNNLERKWNGLARRAKIRSSGETPPRRRGKRGKNWKEQQQEEEETPSGGSDLHTHTEFVDADTDLAGLLSEHFPDSDSGFAALVGLHTCGNLAVDSIRIFLASKARNLVNVGCCYQHLREEFYRNVYLTDAENEAVNADPSFPLSKLLRDRRFKLGRNARMLASQPTNRQAEAKQLPSSSLLWRAVFQVIIVRLYPELPFHEQHVGKLSAKSKDFLEYCKKAFVKLNLQLTLTDSEVKSTFEAVSIEYERKLNAFHQLRILFAPLIEGLILLDRLVHLLEQVEVKIAVLVKLFDPVVSPRCYALIAQRGNAQ